MWDCYFFTALLQLVSVVTLRRVKASLLTKVKLLGTGATGG